MKKRKWLLSLCIMFLMIVLSGNVAEAKSSKVKLLQPGKAYYYDLDGNKKKEKIVCKIVEQYNCYVKWEIYINDKLAASKEYVDTTADFYLLNFNTKDKYMELGVSEGIIEQAYQYTTVFRYKGGKLQNYFKLSHTKILGRYSFAHKQPGNGKIYFLADTPVYSENLGCYFVKVTYKVSNGKLKKLTGKTYTVAGNWAEEELSYQLTRSVNVRRSMTDSRTKYTIKKGTTIYLKKVYISNDKIKYIYIRSSSGKKGWIKLPKGKFVESTHLWG